MECAASRVALAIFSEQAGRLRLERHEEVRFPAQPDVVDGWLGHTRTALAELGRRVKGTGPVTLVLPPHLVLTKMIRAPRAEPGKRDKAIAFAAEENIPHPLTEVTWGSVIAAEGDDGLEVMLAAVRREVVESLCAAARAAGFEPRGVLPAPLATLAAFRLDRVSVEPAMVLSLGARSVVLLLVEGPRFVVRTLAFGARLAGGSDEQVRDVLATRLAQEVTRSLLYFQRRGGLWNPARIHLTGGGATLAGLSEALATKLNVPVERLEVSGAMTVDDRGMMPAGEVGAPVLTELVGAAATVLLRGQVVLDLSPPSLRHRTKRRRQQCQLVGAALLLAALPLALWPSSKVASIKPRQAVAAVPAEAPTEAVPTPLPERPPQAETEETPRPDMELLGVKFEAYPLQLVAYFGEPGDYLAAFVRPGRPETILARNGHRFAELGLVLRSFEVRKIEVARDEAGPIYEVAGRAVVQEEVSGQEVLLDSRVRRLADKPRALLRLPTASEPANLGEGETFTDTTSTYRLEQIQADPPEVVLARQDAAGTWSDPIVLRLADVVKPEAGIPVQAMAGVGGKRE